MEANPVVDQSWNSYTDTHQSCRWANNPNALALIAPALNRETNQMYLLMLLNRLFGLLTEL